MAVNRANKNVGYGLTNALQELAPQPIISQRDPTGSDKAETGTLWVNTANNAYWVATSTTAGVTNWQAQLTGTGVFADVEITGTSGDVLTVASGGDTVLGGTLDVAGLATFASDVNVVGDITFEGEVVIDSADPITIQTSAAGTGAFTLETSDSTGDIEIIGAGGVSLASANTPIALTSGTGAINVGTDGFAKTVTVGNVTGATAVNINSGTGGTHLVSTGAGDITLASSDTVLIDSAGVLELNSSGGVIGIGNDAVAQNINIGTGAAARTITVGSATAGTAVAVRAGTGGLAVSTGGIGSAPLTVVSSDTLLLDSTGVLELNSSAGAISIGNDAVAQNINVGTGAAARTITVGNVTSTTAVVVSSGTGGIAMASTGAGDITLASADTLLLDSAGILEINSSAGAINIGNDSISSPINIGTGASGNRTITIGNTAALGSVNLVGGTVNVGANATSHSTVVGSTTGSSALILNTPTGTNVLAANGLSVTTAGRGLSLPGGVLVLSGAGSPDTVVTAPVGSLFLRTDPAGATSRAYINTNGTTTWTNITCAA